MIIKKAGSIVSLLLFLGVLALKLICGGSIVPLISVAIMLIFLVMLICEVMPITIICILTLGFMPVLGVTRDFNGALTGFSNQVVFFILASFGIASALIKVPLSKRVLKYLLVRFGKNSKLLVLVFMIATSLISSVMSNVPACAIFIAIITELLKLLPEEDRKKTGKTFMIGIPVASMIGGIMTPAGSSINLLALSILESNTDYDITFVQWMCFGIPIVMVILPLAWMILIKVFPPAQIENNKINTFIGEMNIPEKFQPQEKHVLMIFSVIFALWLASSWIHSINIMVVSLIGCAVFCIPGFGVLSAKEFFQKVSWDAIFLVGTVLSLASALSTNGVSDKMISMLPDMGDSQLLIYIGIAVITFILLIFIPVAPSLVALFTPVAIHIALSANINPALGVMLCAMCAGQCYLFPLDTVCLLSYSHGYYKMFEMPKMTAIIQACFVVVSSLFIYSIGTLVL